MVATRYGWRWAISFIIVYYHIHVIYNFFYNSDPKEIIKDLQPWTKCSHYSDDIQRMAIFSGSSDERVSYRGQGSI